MRITFLLPGPGRGPVGGFKIVYEYGNHLAARGHAVTVLHAGQVDRSLSPAGMVRRRLAYAARRMAKAHGPSRWFPLDHRVRSLWVPSLDDRYVPEGDAVVATAWQTAEWVVDYPVSKGRKVYLIQSQENWAGPEDRVMATWKMPLTKVVISGWLQEIAESLGEKTIYVPNGLDFDAFGPDVPPQARRADSLLMLHHRLPLKGTRDGLLALQRVREAHPEVSVQLFGTGAVPNDLPRGFSYHRSPSREHLRTLYNEAAIFVAPSLIEGWPLPPAEAMMSGCALAATDIGGHREYAVPGETALLSPPGDPEAMAANLIRLIEDEDLRLRLVRNGLEFISQFTWTRAVDALEPVLRSTG